MALLALTSLGIALIVVAVVCGSAFVIALACGIVAKLGVVKREGQDEEAEEEGEGEKAPPEEKTE